MPRKYRFDLAALVAAVALLAVLAWLRGAQQASQISVPSTFDTGGRGYAALYDLLSRENVAADRFEFPIGEVPAGGTLVVAGDGALDTAASSRSALAALDHWVRSGGRLVVLDGHISQTARSVLGLPLAHGVPETQRARTGCAFVPALRAHAVAGTFASAYAPACDPNRATLLRSGAGAVALLYRRGNGSVAVFSRADVFDNMHLAQQQNARVAYALFAGGGPVRFDERVYGYAAGKSFWDVLPAPVRVAIVIAAGTLLLGIIGANLPFAAPYAPEAPDERDSGAYIASLARMLQRGGAAAEAIARIRGRCEHALSSRAAGDERARMLLRELRTLEATPRPGSHEVLAAGRIFARVRKDYGC